MCKVLSKNVFNLWKHKNFKLAQYKRKILIKTNYMKIRSMKYEKKSKY